MKTGGKTIRPPGDCPTPEFPRAFSYDTEQTVVRTDEPLIIGADDRRLMDTTANTWIDHTEEDALWWKIGRIRSKEVSRGTGVVGGRIGKQIHDGCCRGYLVQD